MKVEEFVEIDSKYGIKIVNQGAEVYLTRYGINWHEPVAAKPWIAAAYRIEKLQEERDKLLTKLLNDGIKNNIETT